MSSFIRLYYNPLDEFERLFDDAFNARFRPSSSASDVRRTSTHHVESFRPRMNVKESKDSNTVMATFELPGLKAEDITIDVQSNRLTVSGAPSVSNEIEEGGYTVHERRRGKFARTISLPFGTKAEDVKAKLENGVLAVTFPKSTPEQQPQRISIQ